MNLLLVDQFSEIGGAQRCLLDLIAGLSNGVALHAAVPEGPLARVLSERGIPSVLIPSGSYGFGQKRASDAMRFGADTFRQARILRRVIVKHSIDVVYVNGPRVLAGAALAAHGRCRAVFHAHNYLSHWYDRAVIRLALKRGVSTLACCEHVAEGIKRAHGHRVRVIHNGVPDIGFRVRHYPPAGAWRIGIIGRISREKGHLVLLAAMRLLVAEGYPMALMVGGASQFGSGAYEVEVRKDAAGMDVRFAGWSQDIGPVFESIDVLVVPSIAEPGLPRVVLEAFAAGVPVVAAPTGGITEAVRDCRTGFLAKSAMAEDLAAKLRSVLDAPPAELESVVRRARAEWERYWNADRWRREVLSVIRTPQPAPAQPLRKSGQQNGYVAP